MFGCDLGLKFYMLKFLLCEGSDRNITVNQDKMYFGGFSESPWPIMLTVTWLMRMSPKQNGKCDWTHGSCKIKEKKCGLIKGKRKSDGNIVSLGFEGKEKDSWIYKLTGHCSVVQSRKLSYTVMIGHTLREGLFPANGLGTHVVICNNHLLFWDSGVRKARIILWRITLVI